MFKKTSLCFALIACLGLSLQACMFGDVPPTTGAAEHKDDDRVKDQLCQMPAYRYLCGQGYHLETTKYPGAGTWTPVFDLSTLEIGDWLAAFPDVQLTRGFTAPESYVACKIVRYSYDPAECSWFDGTWPCPVVECTTVTTSGTKADGLPPKDGHPGTGEGHPTGGLQ
jgi:hypothetical protein